MLARRHKRGVAIVAAALFLFVAGMARSALADEPTTYSPTPVNAMLTKVIDGPPGYKPTGDTYTFSFTRVSPSDAPPIADYVMTVGDDVTLTQGTTSLQQAAVQVSVADILEHGLPATGWPHAGVFEYRVRETGFTQATQESSAHFIINPSSAEYTLRITVKNA